MIDKNNRDFDLVSLKKFRRYAFVFRIIIYDKLLDTVMFAKKVAVMGPVAAVRILHRRKLAEVADDVRPQLEAELAAEHERIAGGVEKAVEIGVVDQIVSPAATRSALAAAIAEADSGRRGQHTNIPL
jgi:acetyl-CoA carboxylase carboxyltransferase component